ncbi:uncharacterized protein LOC132256953 [Phlebotomus argentipes]|uniref:uncharacterized protein LOC132256953 n=1 Tax=Phlebotomus argentipes TaxID=94469 RepID=UPI0028935EFA|nr:uncharacterized protein LOC132256953 [Phlebotomus argentipes]
MSFRKKKGVPAIQNFCPLPVKAIANSYDHTGILKGFVVLVENEDSVKILQENGCFGQRIPGRSDGLYLLKEEAFFLHNCLKCLKIVTENQEILSTESIFDHFCRSRKNFVTSFIAYQYLKSKKWVIKSGLKFGGDFLLYREGPEIYHSSYVVFLQDEGTVLKGINLQSLYRTTEASGKDLLILHVNQSKDFQYCHQDPQCLADKFNNFTVSEVNPRRFSFHPT